MIHIIIGTKAQYIKTAPLLRQLDAQGILYNLIDTGQHAHFTESLRKELAIRKPDVFLRKGRDITTVFHACCWCVKYILLAFFYPNWVLKYIFRNKKGICVTHGDTPSTLLSIILSKRIGLKVAHIEAGLRSFNYLNPFPEEIIRVLTMRFADLLFTPSDWAYNNTQRMRVRGKVINLRVNTNIESTNYAVSQDSTFEVPFDNYVVATIHRVETILSKRRMHYITDLMARIAPSKPVVFVLHEPTILQLKKFRLYNILEKAEQILLLPLLKHADFIHLIENADYIITDGGSIQEESYYLNIPCLVMREKTERREGLGKNVCLAEFSDHKIAYFLDNYQHFAHTDGSHHNKTPSEEIVDHLLKYAN